MTASVGDLPVISARVALPYLGGWHATIEATGESELSGQQTTDIDGEQFVGTVTRCSVYGGRVKLRVAGGAGGLPTELDARHYVAPSALLVVQDILSACGEELDSSHQLTGVQLPSWERAKGPASHALGRLVASVGMVWRVTRAGKIWIGADTYPEQEVEHRLLDEEWGAGLIEIAPDVPDLRPGVTFRGQQIRYVVHDLNGPTLRTEAYLEPPGGLLNRFLDGLRREIDYSRSYPGRVVVQNANGSLQVMLDDAKMKGSGLDRVPIRVGLPGFSVKVEKGARVSVSWDAGDPARPYAALWDGDGHATEVEFKPGASSPVVRAGDSLQVMIPLGVSLVGFVGEVPFQGVLMATSVCAAIAQGGNAHLKA